MAVITISPWSLLADENQEVAGCCASPPRAIGASDSASYTCTTSKTLLELQAGLPDLLGTWLMRGTKQEDVELRYIQPGNPQQNTYIEQFNYMVR